MPRKPKKGYFVRGQFIAEGSELDLELQRELRGGDGPSKTELKRESTGLQQLGEQLLGLRADLLEPLALPGQLVDALHAARRITDFEGRRRQLQFVGKLMRRLDAAALDAVRAALDAQRAPSARATGALHRAEAWRERLLADDAALGDWIAHHPGTDAQGLRALVRQARRDAQPDNDKPGATARHGRSFRELFQLVNAQLQQDEEADEPGRVDEETPSHE